MNPQTLNSIQNLKKMHDEMIVAKFAKDLIEIHKTLIEKMDVLNKKGDKGDSPTEDELLALIVPLIENKVKQLKSDLVEEITPSDEYLLSLIEPLIPEVSDGENGQDGLTPTEEEIVRLIKLNLPKANKQVINEDLIVQKVLAKIKIPKIEQPKITSEMILEAIKGKKVLGAQNVDGLEQTISSHFNQLKARGGYIHGGGDTVAAGTNVTVTTVNGAKVISATGGANVEIPTGTIDGSNTTYTVTNTPKYIIVDGVSYFENNGYTLAGLTITTTVAPTGYIRSIY